MDAVQQTTVADHARKGSGQDSYQQRLTHESIAGPPIQQPRPTDQERRPSTADVRFDPDVTFGNVVNTMLNRYSEVRILLIH